MTGWNGNGASDGIVQRASQQAPVHAPSLPSAAPPQPSPLPGDRKRVLVVEDEAVVAFDLRMRLTRLGYDVPQPLASGPEVLDYVADQAVDLVLMDIHLLGEMDGIETAHRLAQTHDIPVIFVTAYCEDSTLMRARATQPYGYLLKPFSERELHSTIQMALERHRRDSQLAATQASLRLALKAAKLITWELAPPPSLEVIWHSDDDDESLPPLLSSMDEADRAPFLAALSALRADTCAPHQIEFHADYGHGRRSYRMLGRSFPSDGRRHTAGVIEDITQRKADEGRLLQAGVVFDCANDAILILDAQGKVTQANPAFTRLTGYDVNDILNGVPFLLEAESLGSERHGRLWRQVTETGRWQGELRAHRRDGSHFQAWLTIVRIADQAVGHQPLYVVMISDVTALRGAEEQLAWLAYHDGLTGLPNRLLLLDRIDQMLKGRDADGTAPDLALLFVDLDYFKRINDSLGHAAGDELLGIMGNRLSTCVNRRGVVGRMGDDDFLVILDHAGDHAEATRIASGILAELTRPVDLSNGRAVTCGISIGIAFHPLDGATSEQLLAAADAALNAAKQAGRNRYALYSPDLTSTAERFLEKNHEVRQAMARRELCLFYQPQVTFPDQRTAGVEALIRWNHPTRGLLSPTDIIPVAEEAGLMDEIGTWVLEEACRQLREWLDGGLPPLRMAVNVSPRQLIDFGFAALVQDALSRHDIPPHLLEIEVTESALQQGETAVAILNRLKEIGVTIALDDFGTGFSCLSSLKKLPIHRIKIDQSFVLNLLDNPDDRAITTTIITLGHQLHRQVIAEGVETLAQAELLRQLGCDEFQGFLFSQPQPARSIPGILSRLALAARTAEGGEHARPGDPRQA